MKKIQLPPIHWSLYILINIVFWYSIQVLSDHGLDGYGDMVENYGWSQNLAWGTFKHPPLISWIVHFWFSIFPTQDWAYYVLSWVNVGLTLWGVSQLAKICVTEPLVSPQSVLLKENESIQNIRWLCVALASFILPFSTLASKYNANTVLLPIWAWATVFFLYSWTKSGWKGLLCSILLGVLSALGVLGKYYTGVLLVSFLIAALLHPTGRKWFRTINPYLSLAFFLVSLFPHYLWFKQHDFITFKFVEEQNHHDGIEWKHIISFVFSYYYYLIIMWLLAYYFVFGFKAQSTMITKIIDFFKVTFPSKDDGSVWLCLSLFPMLISIAFGLADFVSLTSHWAIPIWFCVPVLVICKRKVQIDSALIARVWRTIIVLWLLIIAVSSVRVLNKLNNSASVPTAYQEITLSIFKDSESLNARWVGGMWQEAAGVAFYSPTHPYALPGLPDSTKAQINSKKNWMNEEGILVCVALKNQEENYASCQNEIENWLVKLNKPIHKKEFFAHSSAWYDKNSKTQSAVVYFYHGK